jgi:hypothetical protein
MGSFEFAEELLYGPGAAFTDIFQPLSNAFASVRTRGNVQQALVRLCILNHSRRLPIHCEHDGALALFDLLEKLSRAAAEGGEGLNVEWNVKHDKEYSTFKGAGMKNSQSPTLSQETFQG